jgi:hypothetical protein
MMANSAWWVLMGLVYVVVLGVGAVWTYFSIRFFIKGAQYYESKLGERTARNEHQAELLAKLDQLVDVLKVK